MLCPHNVLGSKQNAWLQYYKPETPKQAGTSPTPELVLANAPYPCLKEKVSSRDLSPR